MKIIDPTEVKITTHNITAFGIPDVWFQLLYDIQKYGFKYTIDRGSFEGNTRLEFFNVSIDLFQAYAEPYDRMLPEIPAHLNIPNPVNSGYIEQYLPKLLEAHIEPNEEYTYGSRIHEQIEFFIDVFKKTPNTNQAILQIAQPSDCLLSDPPCLRHIDMRIYDDALIFYPY